MKKYMDGNLKSPNFFLFLAIFFSAIVLFISGKHTYRVMEDVLENSVHSRTIIGRVENIRLYDEVLTSSTLLAASTGDVQWEKRYNLFEPKLDSAINEFLRMDPLHAINQTLKMTDSANIQLVALEHHVFELVHLGKRNEAYEIITGSEYARQKAFYSEGLTTFIKLHELETDKLQTRLRNTATNSKWSFGLVILLLLIVWLPIERFLRKSRAQMLKQNQELELQVQARKESESAIFKSKEQYRLLVESAPDIIFTIANDSTITSLNPAFETLSFWMPEEWIGKPFAGLIHPDDLPLLLDLFQQAIQGDVPSVFEARILTKQGNYLFFEFIIRLIWENSEIKSIMGISRHITERKKAEEKINILAHAVKNSADCIIITNKDNQIIFVNDSFCKTFGFKENEIVGQPIAVIHSENNLPEVSNDLLSTLAKKEMWTGEVLNKRKDGNDFPVQLSLSPLLTDQGELIAVVGVLRDITERKRAEEELARQQYLMNMLMDFLPDHIYFKDLESRFVRINKSFALLFGLNDPDRAIGKSDFDFFSEEHSRQAYQDEQTIIRTGQPLSMEEKETYHDRPDSWVSTIKMPFFDKDGKISGTFGISKDITKNKLAQEKIKIQNEELQKLNAEKDKFFSIIAHDLKSPFNAIVGFSEILDEQVKEKNFQGIEEYTGIILQSSHQAMDLLMNLMEWSRSQTGRMKFNPAYFEMAELINEVVLLLTNVAGQKSIVITKTLPNNFPVYADKNMLSVVLRNLIANAIKYTHPGGAIIISAEERGGLTVSVSDNGVGIPKDRIEQLFRIDENYSTFGTQNERGTGLGLILCKEFIEKHEGKIWVESEEGKGSVFYFTIP